MKILFISDIHGVPGTLEKVSHIEAVRPSSNAPPSICPALVAVPKIKFLGNGIGCPLFWYA